MKAINECIDFLKEKTKDSKYKDTVFYTSIINHLQDYGKLSMDVIDSIKRMDNIIDKYKDICTKKHVDTNITDKGFMRDDTNNN